MNNRRHLELVAQRVTRLQENSDTHHGVSEPIPARHRPTGPEAALDAAFNIRQMQINGGFGVAIGLNR